MNPDNFNDKESYDENKSQDTVFSDEIIRQYNRKKRRENITGIVIVTIAILALVVMTVFGISNGSNNFSLDKTKHNINITIPVQSKPQLDKSLYDEETGLYTAEGIAKRVMPSVVSILCYQEDENATVSQGSGIILTENGYIITNAHVVEDATKAIRVILNNEKQYNADLVGKDVKTDLAVIKINADNLVAADFGDSSELSIGEDVVALGSPAGLYGSLTKGVVSGLNRMIKTDPTHLDMNCIQIDAAINPGNSGGALVNMYGQVVGINTSKYMSDSYDGIGFAISFDAAKPILEELIENGYIKDRFRIGITFYEIPENTAAVYDIVAGLKVESLSEDCDISNTELAPEDTIIEINGQKVLTKSDVTAALEGKKPGDTVKAKVARTSQKKNDEIFEIEFKLMNDSSMEITGTDDK